MTTFVPLIFIAMIPIDYKITNFPLHLFYIFCNNNYIWWTYKHYFKQKNDQKYYFCGWHTH